MRSLVLILLATACGGSENAIAEQQGGGDDTDGQIMADEDGDGYTDDDCDEANAAVNPGAAEICDGVDNNCDGLIDEEQVDSDSDGVCDSLDECPDDPSNTCGLVEVCDGQDNDGDGEIDEGMTDTDGDGICDEIDDDEECVATDEVCDGLDNDCDIVVDEGVAQVTASVDPGNGQCAFDTQLVESAGSFNAEVTCGVAVYVACNDNDATVDSYVGELYADSCVWLTDTTSPGYNSAWPAGVTTCWWLGGEELAHF